ncbi:hypothetical protein Halhy_0499 [Haliscomenobacter hydrossis DSM 1100]|uniref:Uncharacterized protein n=1 Tax=Haliscomenobacter hydrossis (strain ATCC 27775 / DSM 1100 / LMG 10767 / O) TaxID=760192 RepID=F4KZB4_HALH1|nr:hypothetical protein Halhy_0499 [Haliscomenobacter hydrossis DSM 1100]
MRLYAGLILFACFIGWALYRLLVKRDLGAHKIHLQVGLCFMSAWALIYWFLLS